MSDFSGEDEPPPKSHAELTLRQIRQVAGQGMTSINEALLAILRLSLNHRRLRVEKFVRDNFGDTVQSGPFRGMRCLPGTIGSCLAPKLLGTYEQELHRLFEQLDRYDHFVNVGCAEGYYAVGVLCAAPHLRSTAFDIDDTARRHCLALASANGVADRITVEAHCDGPRLSDAAAPRTLVLVDVEGAETELIAGADLDRLALCDLLIETHGFKDRGTTADALAPMLRESHDVEIVGQGPRDPRPFEPLMKLRQLDRFLAQWEGRGADSWILARSRERPDRAND